MEFEFLINERDAENWTFSDQPRIARPLSQCIQTSRFGLPTTTPEVLLFFKATAYFGMEEQGIEDRPQDTADFNALIQSLAPEARYWLSGGIGSLHPEHPWLAQTSQ